MAAVMPVRSASVTEWMTVNRGNVALEFSVFTFLAIDRKLGIQYFPFISAGPFGGLPQGCTDKFCLRHIKILTQLLDQRNEIFLVIVRIIGIITILVSLPEEKPGNFVAFPPPG